MKKIIFSLALSLGLAVTLPAVVLADSHDSGELDNHGCGNGQTVVNVTYKLLNDYDSGVKGNAWANDTINRHLRIVKTSAGYCAEVRDHGSFVTFAGYSPGGTGTVGAGVKGEIEGGYVTTAITGTLAAAPAYATHGHLGTFDLKCDASFSCPGTHPTVSSYVSGWDGNLAWWGWYYHTDQNGNWVNAMNGNTGDITGSVQHEHDD